MALATRCPHCKTTFKVAHDQLKLRSGLVRCGACKLIFNGIEHLVRPEDADSPGTPATSENQALAPAAILPQVEEAPPPVATEADTGVHDLIETAPPDLASIDALEFIPVDDPETQTLILASEPPPDEPWPQRQDASLPEATPHEDALTPTTLVDFSVFSEDLNAALPQERVTTTSATEPVQENAIWPAPQNDQAEPEFGAGGENDAATPSNDDGAAIPATSTDATSTDVAEETHAETTEAMPAADDEDAPEDAEEPAFVTSGRRRQRRSRAAMIFMAIASIVLFAAAIGQSAYAFRNQLTAWFPQTRPALTRLCELAACQISLPAQIEQVSIESNELQAQATNKNIFTLSMLLHNRSTVAQTWPHIELTLNDNNGKALVRRALSPREYLPSERERAAGIAAGSEQTVKLSFELSQFQASDYRVYLFYP